MIIYHEETERKLPQLFNADDATLLAESEEELVRIVDCLDDVC